MKKIRTAKIRGEKKKSAEKKLYLVIFFSISAIITRNDMSGWERKPLITD